QTERSRRVDPIDHGRDGVAAGVRVGGEGLGDLAAAVGRAANDIRVVGEDAAGAAGGGEERDGDAGDGVAVQVVHRRSQGRAEGVVDRDTLRRTGGRRDDAGRRAGRV